MYFDYANVFVFLAFGAIFVVLNVSILSRLLRPTVREAAKETTYECGETPVGSGWVRFDIRFYTVALVFLIFDVEVAFLYPWSVLFQDAKRDGVAAWKATEERIAKHDLDKDGALNDAERAAFEQAAANEGFTIVESPTRYALFLFTEVAVFLGILIVGFIYIWAKGDLSWIKTSDVVTVTGPGPPVPGRSQTREVLHG